MKRSRILSNIAALCASAASIGYGAGEDSRLEAATSVEQELYGAPSPGATYWNSQEGEGVVIPVCWTARAKEGRDVLGNGLPAGHPGWSVIQQRVRRAVENTWGRVANIRFTGWNSTCAIGGGDDNANRFLPANRGKIMYAFDTTRA